MVGIDLTGKNVLITGGASGIGKASAKSFAATGARVAVTDIDRDGIQETVRGLGNEHFAIDGDISNKNDVDKIIKAAVFPAETNPVLGLFFTYSKPL